MELRDPAVKPHLRSGGNIGMMVLPVSCISSISISFH